MSFAIASDVPKEGRVRALTPPEINERIDAGLEQRLRFYAAQDERAITQRIQELDREWDIERLLEAKAASLTLLGIVLGATRSRIWYLLPLAVAGFLAQQAIQGWCPPVLLLRKLGARTSHEIEQERHALKFLRGDFATVERGEGGILRDHDKFLQSIRK
jgi:hypothetical protein